MDMVKLLEIIGPGRELVISKGPLVEIKVRSKSKPGLFKAFSITSQSCGQLPVIVEHLTRELRAEQLQRARQSTQGLLELLAKESHRRVINGTAQSTLVIDEVVDTLESL